MVHLNGNRSNSLEANNLLHYARSRVLIRHRMRNMHVSPKIIAEFERTCESIICETLREHGVPVFRLKKILDAIITGEASEEVRTWIRALVIEPRKQKLTNFNKHSLHEIISEALRQLNFRSAEVIGRRFGFQGQRETLQSIAIDLKLTRERVRQIESRAIQDLKQLINLKELRSGLKCDSIRILQTTANTKAHLLVTPGQSENEALADLYLSFELLDKYPTWLPRHS
jgi:Sigma-70, region 4